MEKRMLKNVYEELRELASDNIYIYIWGAGKFAQICSNLLERNNVRCDGMVVADEYAEAGQFTRSELLRSNRPYVIILGNDKSLSLTKKEIYAHWPGCIKELVLTHVYEFPVSVVEPLSWEEYEANKPSFDEVRRNLADERSRQTLDAWLHAKLCGGYPDDKDVLEPKQYFFPDAPWKLGDREIFVDCGAYDGDSIESFVETCRGNYEKIVAFEPDPENYRKLCENVKAWGLQNVQAVQRGVSKNHNIYYFHSGAASGSSFSEDGDIKVEVDSIDNALHGDPATIIKMDIEGSERDALTGATDTIRKYRPILMICVYHKKDDVYRLYRQIRELAPDYSYFLRWHVSCTGELVLYCVPKERVMIPSQRF